MHIFRRIFLSSYWWQESDIWSQASYMYPISWVAFLDPSDSYFLFADFVDFSTHWTYMFIFRRIFLSYRLKKHNVSFSGEVELTEMIFIIGVDSFIVKQFLELGLWCLASATFNNISVILWQSVLLVEETGVLRENHRPATSKRQTWSHNVVHLVLSEIQTHNISGDRHRLHR
jgi:hypothetical protein